MRVIERKLYLEKLKKFKDKQLIKVITGIRRCGKSTLLELFQDYLKQIGIDEKQIITINFENPDYKQLKTSEALYDYIKSKLTKGKMNYIFLDEIQNVEKFEVAVDGLFINKNVDLYITGSNAYLLSSELATLLTGRYVEIKMLPLSFKEYMSALEDKSDLSRKFREYLRYGSFPQTLDLYDIPEEIETYLDGIYTSVLYKDVIHRKGITDKGILESVVEFLYDNIGNLCSMKKISDTLTSNGRAISNHTVENYVDALIDSFMLYKANRFDVKGKDLLKTQEKYYAVDIGLRYHLLGQKAGQDMGHILENIVYLELLRRGYKVYVGKLDELEVDFVAQNSENIIYYQVALTTREESTLERELLPLRKINDNYPKIILTLDDDLDADFEGIKKKNVIDWLLKSENCNSSRLNCIINCEAFQESPFT